MPNFPKTELQGSEIRGENPVPDAFWGAIGYKVNDIPCSEFALQTVQSGNHIPGPKNGDQTSIQKPNREAFWSPVGHRHNVFHIGG